MILQILLPPGSPIIVLQVYLLGGSIVPHQIYPLLRGPVPAPLMHLHLKGLGTQTPHSTGELTTTPEIWPRMSLIRCLEPRALEPQKGPLANMALIQTSPLHGKSMPSPALEISSPVLKGARIQIQIFLLHGTDPDPRILTLTCPHRGGSEGPALLIQICLHLRGVSLQERRLRTCILEPKRGWC